MNKPFFSIILPVYNVEDYICRCLESLFDQNLDKELYELIIVNDGTPDDSMKIVDKFKEGHSNIIIHNQENRGVSSARNIGMSLSSGEYLLFVDQNVKTCRAAIAWTFGLTEKQYNPIIET